MKSFLLLLLLFVSVCLLTSCRCKQQAVIVTEPVYLHQKDSVRVEYVERIMIDTIMVEVPIPLQSVAVVTSDSVSVLETDFAVSKVILRTDGFFSHTLENKEQKLGAEAYVPIKEVERSAVEYVDREVPVRVPYAVEVEKSLSAWQEFRLTAFWYLVGAIAVALVWIFRKQLLKIISRIFGKGI